MLSILSDLFREVIEAEPIGDRKGEEADHAKCRPDNTEHFAFPALRIGKGSLLELERHLPVSQMLGWDEETSFSVRKRDVLAAPRCLLPRWRQCGTKGTVRQGSFWAMYHCGVGLVATTRADSDRTTHWQSSGRRRSRCIIHMAHQKTNWERCRAYWQALCHRPGGKILWAAKAMKITSHEAANRFLSWEPRTGWSL